MPRESLSGHKLGNYDVGPLVGSGGMGEVYRGRDTALNRDVAIKVLLPAVAADHERLARFNREAQVLASLNHPNIAHIHGLETAESGPFLVMEFVEGPTLADRIAQGPIPLDEALAMARQIADALESAHERGIIHRDLKPANIKVSDDGAVKVLDFGLAKALDQASGIGDQGPGERANSPTITTPAMTQAGLILGTAAYMSPEQAKGRVVDKRSDVWAFGCVLYEMLTGKRAFEGEDVTDTIAAVVRGEPNWSALPPDVAPQIRLLLKRCLEKDRRARTSDIGVARFLMNETIDSAAAAGTSIVVPAGSRGRLVGALSAGLLVGAIIIAGLWALAPRSPSATRQVRFVLTPPASEPLVVQGNDKDVAIAPDGSFVVFRAGDPLLPHLVIRAVNEVELRALPGTTNARYPFISADGRWVAFFVGPELRKLPLAGGAPTMICRISGAPRGASWGDDDFIVLADSISLQRVSANGGELKKLTNTTEREVHGYPHVMPGSKTVLFSAFDNVGFLRGRIEAVDVGTGARKVVIPFGTDPAYMTSGFLTYAVANALTDAQSRFRGSLRVVRFDASRVETVGESVPAFEPIFMGSTGAGNYGLSRRGDLVFVPGNTQANIAATPQRTLTWVDRAGKETPITAQPRGYAMGRISPDGRKIALDVRDQTNDVWIWDIDRQLLTSLNRDPGQDLSPIWTPDSQRIIWTSTRTGSNPNLYWQKADGTGAAESLTKAPGNQFPTTMTPDGKTVLLFGAGDSAARGMDIFAVDVSSPDRTAKPLITTNAIDFDADLSPDGKWLAYHSNESGDFEVYVRPFPNVQDGRSQISANGGTRAAWARNGRELFYLDKDGFLTSVPVLPPSGAAFSAGAPVRILNTKYLLGSTLLGLDLRAYDVAPDGQRFLMIKDPAREAPASVALASMVFVLNWADELKARLPTP